MIEQAAARFLCRFELFKEVCEDLRVEAINSGDLLDPLLIIAMMCERVVRVGNLNLRVYTHAALAPHHKARDASKISLERDHLQVKHYLRVFGKRNRNPGRLLYRGVHISVAFLCALDALFDLPDRVEVFINLATVSLPETLAERVSVFANQ